MYKLPISLNFFNVDCDTFTKVLLQKQVVLVVIHCVGGLQPPFLTTRGVTPKPSPQEKNSLECRRLQKTSGILKH
jgi:hypothetical protein